ncbi:signal peptidase II [Chloroflexota bacterium]
MREESPSLANWKTIGFFIIAALVVSADQLSKIWIRTHLLTGQVSFNAGFFQIVYVRNTGAAFGLFPNQSLLLSYISVIGVAVILFCALFLPRHLPFLGALPGRAALGLVLGGTVGNLIDRLYLGYVTDFINFGFWPAFNVADSAVTVGALWLVYSLLSETLAERKKHG